MQTRMIRDLEVPVVGMGSAGSFDVPMSELEVRKQILDKCISQGSNFVDTSPMYRRSEQVIGAAMEGKRDKFQLATKVWCTGRDTAVRQMARSLNCSGRTTSRLCRFTTWWTGGLICPCWRR